MKKTTKKAVEQTIKKTVKSSTKATSPVKTTVKKAATKQAPVQKTTPDSLNKEQTLAVKHKTGPLLIIAGAGTGKTKTLVHRVASLIHEGVEPNRILLLTFTRRAAAEMQSRVRFLLETQAKTQKNRQSNSNVWGGTFHAVGTRLLRMYGQSIGISSDFTILDRSDSEDLVGTIRAEMQLDKATLKFPKKATCMTVFSLHVNSRVPMDTLVATRFPWLKTHTKTLVKLFDAYQNRKAAASTLDYDDILTHWLRLLENKEIAAKIVDRFDHVLVDEYQDTNIVQSDILRRLCPKGKGLTVVGDDAQSIYSFRAATIRNILDFPKQFPGTKVVKLEQNYRSTPTILATTNQVISRSTDRYKKNLRSEQNHGPQPIHYQCYDDSAQVGYVVKEIQRLKSEGIPYCEQAVLFRASHHSLQLETELARKGIPFHKFGGLKFVEAAHIKDLLGFLRFAENQRDEVAAVRSLSLLSGIGEKKALTMTQEFNVSGDIATGLAMWKKWKPPKSAATSWAKFLKLFEELTSNKLNLQKQIEAALKFYKPILEAKYDNHRDRFADLSQLQEIAVKFKDRAEMLTALTLDPPNSTDELPEKKKAKKTDDYLTLSTIHSAKGLEWDTVYVIHASDGFIPSDKATDTEGIEEELRLFYVALTRAKCRLYICSPRYFYLPYNSWSGDDGYKNVSRFIDSKVSKTLQEVKAK